MTLGGDLTAALPQLRAAAESMMIDTWTGTRGAGAPVLDTETGEYTSTSATVYTGPGRLRFRSNAAVLGVDAQTQNLVQQQPTLSLPVAGSEGVRIGDTFTCTAAVNDSAVVGTVVRVTGVHVQTYSTARRFPVELISGA